MQLVRDVFKCIPILPFWHGRGTLLMARRIDIVLYRTNKRFHVPGLTKLNKLAKTGNCVGANIVKGNHCLPATSVRFTNHGHPQSPDVLNHTSCRAFSNKSVCCSRFDLQLQITRERTAVHPRQIILETSIRFKHLSTDKRPFVQSFGSPLYYYLTHLPRTSQPVTFVVYTVFERGEPAPSAIRLPRAIIKTPSCLHPRF
mmetsp:Transcript_26417/g.102952  ORF Transcript_26417/g.102952 Transcript_26417/m.102952 type:complete len:200 (+) Transcript_26417:2598-3197(+)